MATVMKNTKFISELHLNTILSILTTIVMGYSVYIGMTVKSAINEVRVEFKQEIGEVKQEIGYLKGRSDSFDRRR